MLEPLQGSRGLSPRTRALAGCPERQSSRSWSTAFSSVLGPTPLPRSADHPGSGVGVREPLEQTTAARLPAAVGSGSPPRGVLLMRFGPALVTWPFNLGKGG